MRIEQPLTEGTFVRRDNRFRASVRIDGQITKAHLPNSGRLGELLVPGRPVLLAHRPAAHRTTSYDLVMVPLGEQLVSVDSRLPSRLFREAVRAGWLDAFSSYTQIQSEVSFGDSRLDFRLDNGDKPCYVEVKSVTLVEAGRARFPDAPTTRGTRHIRELIVAGRQGNRAAIVFIVQRSDATCFSPHVVADPAFAQVLREAWTAGVEVYAFDCTVQRDYIAIRKPLPVEIEGR